MIIFSKIMKNEIDRQHTFNLFISFLVASFIFFSLSFVLNILKEITFFEEYNVSIYYPVLLTFLNTRTLIFEIFPSRC